MDVNPLAWKSRAACRGMDPELFFPDRGVVPHEALKACALCPVRVECREYGQGEKHGVWGGVTQREGRRRRRAQREELDVGILPDGWLGDLAPGPSPAVAELLRRL